MRMPASEFVEWQAYFQIFPFNEDRADRRAAMLASVLSYVSGRTLKKPVSEETFIPNYLPEDKPKQMHKSREQQRQEFSAFVAKHQEMTKAARGNK